MRIPSLPKSSSSALSISLCLLIAGCGYQFAASGSNLPSTARTIYVERFSNRTRQTGINDQFMRYVKDEIAGHRRLTLVDTPRDADLELTGEIAQKNNLPSAFNSVLEPTIYNEVLLVRASLRDKRTDKVIWSTNGMSDTERFPVTSQSVVSTTPGFLQQNLRARDISRMTDIQVAQTQEWSSRDQMMTNLAKRMYDSMASGF